MKKNTPEHSDEIDLLGIILTIWEKRFKVILITTFIAVFLSIFSIQMNRQNTVYNATTEIRPISIADEMAYKTYNIYSFKDKNKIDDFINDNDIDKEDDKTNKLLTSFKKKIQDQNENLDIKRINKDYLLKLFIDNLKQNTNFENGIKKFNLIPKEKYINSEDYEDEVKRLASTVQFLPPNNDIKQGKIETYWRIQFATENLELWLKILESINGPLNEQIRLHLNTQHRLTIQIKEKLKKFNIEDIELRMKNAMVDYENVTSNKIAYLKEQANIARKLGIASNNYLEPQNINTGNALVTTLIAKTPDYLRGYEMIEEEISLIKKRVNKKAFIKNFSLLEAIKKDLSTNKDIERLGELFRSTPAYDSNNFYAAKIMHQSTVDEVIKRSNTIKNHIFMIIIGLLIGSFYVLIENAIKKRKKL